MRGRRAIEDSSEQSSSQNEEDDEEQSQESDMSSKNPTKRGAFARCRPKNKRNARFEKMQNPEEEEEIREANPKTKTMSVFVDSKNQESQSSENEQMDVIQSEEQQEIVEEDILSYVDDDLGPLIDFEEHYQDKYGRIVWRCIFADGNRNVTQEALVDNEETRQLLESLGLWQQKSSNKHKQDNSQVKRKVKMNEKEEKKKRRAQKRLQKEERLRDYETKSYSHQVTTVNSLDILSKTKMDAREEKQKTERERMQLKQERINVEAFSDAGKIEEHVPLELIDFIGQPPFRGDTEKLKVLVRWKHDEAGNYQPADSEVEYTALRAKYQRLLIDLFVRKTLLTRF